eukprot:5742950-Heterocapsa_arctica.AAC.1
MGRARGACLRRAALAVSLAGDPAPMSSACSQLQFLQPALFMGDQTWIAVCSPWWGDCHGCSSSSAGSRSG